MKCQAADPPEVAANLNSDMIMMRKSKADQLKDRKQIASCTRDC